MQSSTCRSGGVGFQSINQSFNIYMALLQQRRSTFFLLQGFISSLFTKSLNPSDALFKIRNSNRYGNGVPTAKISVGTPFQVVPIGNEPCSPNKVENECGDQRSGMQDGVTSDMNKQDVHV